MRLASDGDGAFERAEIAVGAECGYRDFEVCIVEMREAQVKAKEALSKAGLAHEKTFRIACKVGSLSRARAVLGSIGADTVRYTTPGGHEFDLYGDRIECHDTEVHGDMMSFLRKALAAHS